MATIKRDYLKSIEEKIQDQWKSSKLFESNFDQNKPKYFVTFPFCYTNGLLHLGHNYTSCRADYMAKYKRMKGYNVLYPFGFHVTGMPIQASANKLKTEIESGQIGPQTKILLDMNVNKNEINKFMDTRYWTQYFPPLGQRDITELGLSIDWRRSFITTSLNPYFDAFIRWQFNHLIKEGLIILDKRPVIYSPKDSQVCNDHDRSIGENIKPIKKIYGCHKIDTLCCVLFEKITKFNKETGQEDIKSKMFFHKDKCYYKCTLSTPSSCNYILTEEQYLNLKHQICPDIVIDKQNVIVPNIKDCDPNPINFIELYEPEETVISRTGDLCCVTLMPQYYIKYGGDEWKSIIKNYINSENFCKISLETKRKFQEAIEWLSDWACTRQFGLGTTFELDPNSLIDSLSDSTIYMAYYTIAHLLHDDIYGQKTGALDISITDITDEAFDYIFDLTDHYKGQLPIEKLDQMKQEFKYWYPLDLRVSGKDLIYNHLTMTLYNHAYIWHDPKYYPKDYVCNGYININNEKMAKNTGNFITIRSALNKWTADSIRLTLADSGDTLNDANFEEPVVNSNVLLIKTEEEWITNALAETKLTRDYNFIDNLFFNNIMAIITEVTLNYEKMVYKNVVRLAFFEMIKLKNRYIDYCHKVNLELNSQLISYYINIFVKLLTPIIPHICEHIWRNLLHNKESVLLTEFPVATNYEKKYTQMWDLLQEMLNEIRGHFKKKTNKESKIIIIKYVTRFPDWYSTLLKLKTEFQDTKAMMKHINAKGIMKDKMKIIAKNVNNLDWQPDFNMKELLEYNIEYINCQFNSYTVQFMDIIDDKLLPWQYSIEFADQL